MMRLNPSEISEVIRQRIADTAIDAETKTVGTIISMGDGIARLHGLRDVMQGEMIKFPGDTYGMALNLERDSVCAVVLGPCEHLAEGQTVECTGRILEVPVGEALLGRVVNALGEPIDGKGPLNASETSPIEKVAPGVRTKPSLVTATPMCRRGQTEADILAPWSRVQQRHPPADGSRR